MQPLRRAPRYVLALVVAALGSASVQAAAALLSAAELSEALKNQPPCCVVDARSAANQRQHPLTGAVRYRPGLSINPTAAVVVVADHDQAAKQAAAALARQYPGKTIYAVKGGLPAWQTVAQSPGAASTPKASGAPPAGLDFVIPHNTCETGTPLQILQSAPKAKP